MLLDQTLKLHVIRIFKAEASDKPFEEIYAFTDKGCNGLSL